MRTHALGVVHKQELRWLVFSGEQVEQTQLSGDRTSWKEPASYEQLVD